MMKRINFARQLVRVVLALLVVVLLSIVFLAPKLTFGAGVTIITHGFAGNVNDWIIPMAEKIPQYYRFPGVSNVSCYEIYFVQDATGRYLPTQRRIAGITPTNSPSGEILIR